ncbi:MAG: hypothetical protein WCH39_24190 [Schlesneria sp.]
MKMQIVSCPHCGTYLLHDTADCHACGHVLNERAQAQSKSRLLPTDGAVSDDMGECPTCHEHCRTGLVRCWSCGTFLRSDIEEAYRKKQANARREVEQFDLPILEATFVTEEDSFQKRDSTIDSLMAEFPYASDNMTDDDDFDLASGAAFGESSDEEFEVSGELRFALEPNENSEPEEQETFRLQATEEEVAPPPIVNLEPQSKEIETSLPPVQAELDAPPVREIEEPPPSMQEVEAAAADDLLKIAADEQKDIQQVRKSIRSKDTFIVFCPQGCRIRVKERHRGKSGKCPRCQCDFVVPKKPVPRKSDADAAPEPVATSRYKKWLSDIRLHTVDPTKLRIKADSLLNECQPVDLGFSEEDLLIATLLVGKFGANPKKIPPLRTAMIEHFFKQGTIEQLTVAAKKVLKKDLLTQLSMAQPAPVGTESLFADIPVFGTNRIAVKLPKMPDSPLPQYLSFSLSEFRAFVEGLQTVCGLEGFGANTEIPLSDEYLTRKCALSAAPIKELSKLNYYQKDPGFKLEVTGWKCAGCGIYISEAARVEAKLGGANGKAIAKAKCPKCTKKFGDQPLYQVAGSDVEKPVESSEPEPAMA